MDAELKVRAKALRMALIGASEGLWSACCSRTANRADRKIGNASRVSGDTLKMPSLSYVAASLLAQGRVRV